MSNTSKTDLERLEKMTDAEIDPSDIAKLDADFFKKAELRVPAKKPITLRVDENFWIGLNVKDKAIRRG